jgi:hypothetical protein
MPQPAAIDLALLAHYDFMQMNLNREQFSYFDKFATLTQLYLELGLQLHDALRAAAADV